MWIWWGGTFTCSFLRGQCRVMTFGLLVCKQCNICRSLWNRDNRGKETVSLSNITVGKLAMMMDFFFFFPLQRSWVIFWDKRKMGGGWRWSVKAEINPVTQTGWHECKDHTADCPEKAAILCFLMPLFLFCFFSFLPPVCFYPIWSSTLHALYD